MEYKQEYEKMENNLIMEIKGKYCKDIKTYNEFGVNLIMLKNKIDIKDYISKHIKNIVDKIII